MMVRIETLQARCTAGDFVRVEEDIIAISDVQRETESFVQAVDDPLQVLLPIITFASCQNGQVQIS